MIIDFSRIFQNSLPLITSDELSALHYPLSDCEKYFTNAPQEILLRQEVFRDFLYDREFFDAFTKASSHLDDAADLYRNLGSSKAESSEELLYALVELLAFTKSIDALDNAFKISKNLTSSRLIALYENIKILKNNEEYCAMQNWLSDLDENMRNIRSLSLGINLDAQLNVTEVGIVSINSQPFVAGNFFDKIMRDEQPPKDYQCLTVVGIQEIRNLLGSGKLTINTEFYNSMNLLYRSALKSLRKKIIFSTQYTIDAITALRDDFHFIIRAVKMLHRQIDYGFSLVFPEIGTETDIDNLFSPLLKDKCSIEEIVPSSCRFTDNTRIYILTGPNSGGKSVYVTSVGIAQLTFQLGLPITASGKTKMKTYERIATHFIEGIERETESRLANESKRLSTALKSVTENTLLLLDETFSSTSAYDALFLSEALMRHLTNSGCDVIYVTHIHELPQRLTDISTLCHIAPEIHSGQRAYRISEYIGKEETLSLAKDIVIENGLGFLFNNHVN